MNTTSHTDQRQRIEVDVLIVGGGVQGLWLLNDLTKVGYNVVLIEKDKIGGSQTLHSHGYIHKGHLYHDIEMVRRLKSSEDRWERFCEKNKIPLNRANSYYGFASPSNADMWYKTWTSAQLPVNIMEYLIHLCRKDCFEKFLVLVELGLILLYLQNV
jgi:glycine/D-amino acid oxidase-like deaminating enzyme